MSRIMINLFVVTVLASGFIFGCSSEKRSSSSGEPQVPAQAENQTENPLSKEQAVEQATFVNLDGEAVPISRFEGKVVLIDFWETWCKPCLASFPTMQKLMDDYPEDFIVLAVSPGWVDSKEDARAFMQEHDYDFVYLYDQNKLHEKLNVQGIPYKVFVDAGGGFVEASLGSRGPQGDYKHAEDLIKEHRGS